MTATMESQIGAIPPASPPEARERTPWRFAVRLARREVRRRPGRTLLVMLLIAVPVCGMTVITVLVRTNTDSAAETFARQFGAADLVGGVGGPVAAAGSAAAIPAFPAGTRVVHAHTASTDIGLALADGTARLGMVTDLDLNDPIAHGIVLLRSGRFPDRAGEVLLSPGLARAFHLAVGGTLRLSTPNWTEKVVGIGVRSTNWTDGLVAVRGNELASIAGSDRGAVDSVALVDLPGHPSADELLAYQAAYISPASISARTTERNVNWILVGGIVALAIVGIVISGAFAVGARRQLVTLGQLSANGADEQLLRRTLSLQGLLSGAFGSAVGFGAGIVILLSMRAQFSSWIHHDPGSYVWSVRDTGAILVIGVIAATIAAYIPARSAARVPVLTALAGRRPLGDLPKRLVPIGAALFAGGVFVLVLVATASGVRQNNGLALSAVFGGLLVLAGACCASSVVVDTLRHAARVARGAARVATRSIVRSRARSAAVVMALAAVNAGAVAIGTAIDSHTGTKAQGAQFMPDDTLIVSNGGDLSLDTPVRRFLPLSASVESTLHKILPDAQWSVRRAVVGPDVGDQGPIPVAGGVKLANPVPTETREVVPPIVTVVSPAVMQLLGLSARDNAALQRVGAIDVQVPRLPNGKLPTSLSFQIGSGPTRTIDAAVAQDQVRATGDSEGFFVTSSKAQELGLTVVDAGVIIHNPTPLNQSQRASIDVLGQSLFLNGASSTSTNIAWSGPDSGRVSTAEVRQIVLAVVVFIALVVLAMSLALSAAESRDERDILVSLGARPATMRAVSSWKAGLLSGAGALVAIPTGFIPVAVVYLAIAKPGEVAHISFPWSTTLQLVLVAPIIAAAVAYAGSAIAQAVRPTRMSTFSTD